MEMEAPAANLQENTLLLVHAAAAATPPKVPSGDGPYVRAKHAQKLVEKDLEGAIVWFRKAIEGGDRVGSALKDMAVVMKQLDRCEEAIEAIKSFRLLCPAAPQSQQDSFDNVLLDLYKKCGRVDEQIALLKLKLRKIYQGKVFNGKPTKTARSHGRKFQVSVTQESARLLGSLGWAYMLKQEYRTAEVVYRKAQMIDADCNKACNLVQCLIKQSRYEEARFFLEEIWKGRYPGSDDPKTITRMGELLSDLDLVQKKPTTCGLLQSLPKLDDDDFFSGLDGLTIDLGPPRSRRLPVFEEITTHIRDQMAC